VARTRTGLLLVEELLAELPEARRNMAREDDPPRKEGILKSLMLLLRCVLAEAGTRCSTSTLLDFKTVEKRVEDEGLSFLTITLPSFGKDFERSLDQGYVDHQLFKSFQKTTRRGGLPRFLGGFLRLVFDEESGLILENPSIDAIQCVRQISLMFAKILLPTSDSRQKKAIAGYLECEQHVRESDANLSATDKVAFSRICSLLYGEVLSEVNENVYYGKIVPRHGPGSTVDKLVGNDKYRQTEWTSRLEREFPMLDFLVPNPGFYQKLDGITVLEPGQERPVRVVLVPKTMKTPRVIAIEPTAMQYVQQGLAEALVRAMARKTLRHSREANPLRHLIGFDDQSPNRRMARDGSTSDGGLATLDLSEASDRVSNQLVRLMFKNYSHLAAGVDACRSRKADVPGHGIIRLAKFASMGSALTFPIEAMVFLAIIFLGIEKERSRPVTRKDVYAFVGSVRVFGDDLIVPERYVHSVIEQLETFGFRVNLSKSFWAGRFRESCGREFYDGQDVSIVKVRREFPSSRRDVREVVSTVALRNNFYKSGWWMTARFLDEILGPMLKHYPAVSETSPVLGRLAFSGYDTTGYDRDTQSPLVKGYVVSPVIPSSTLDDDGALLKVFLKRGELPFADRNHLERSGRPDAARIKLRNASPF
jgi:hypothetical protein